MGIDYFTDYYSREVKEKNIAHALTRKNFELIEADILGIEEFPRVDYVFHEATQAGVVGSWGKQFETYARNNILATQKLLEFFDEYEIKKFIYASSSSVYGNAELPLKEDTVPKPISPYGVTKLASENLCRLYHTNYGLPVVMLRYFTVYGSRQRPDMAIHKLVMTVMNGEEITIFGGGLQTRGFTYVDDVVEANILAAGSDVKRKVFNIGGGDRIRINDLIKLISK
ncbi:UDP-N-acetylglucosamine 4-epimerase [subsurface metagenome]